MPACPVTDLPPSLKSPLNRPPLKCGAGDDTVATGATGTGAALTGRDAGISASLVESTAGFSTFATAGLIAAFAGDLVTMVERVTVSIFSETPPPPETAPPVDFTAAPPPPETVLSVDFTAAPPPPETAP